MHKMADLASKTAFNTENARVHGKGDSNRIQKIDDYSFGDFGTVLDFALELGFFSGCSFISTMTL